MTRDDLKNRINSTLDMIDLSKKGAVVIGACFEYENDKIIIRNETFTNQDQSLNLLKPPQPAQAPDLKQLLGL